MPLQGVQLPPSWPVLDAPSILLPVQDVEPARDCSTSLAQTLMEYLSRPPGEIDCTDVCHMIHEVKDAVIPIVQPHMTEKNWSKIGILAGFYGSHEFASFFLNDPDVAEERAAFLSVLQTQLPEAARRQVCSVVGCFLPRCTMPGSLYCFPHHAVKFQAPPTLDDFLRNSHYCALLREWMVTQQPASMPLLEFYFKAEDYAEVRSRQTLAARAPTLWRKYLASTASTRAPLGDFDGDAELRSALEAIKAVLDGNTPPKATLFAEVQARAHAALEEVFQGPFKASDAYAAWAEVNTGLPLPQVPATRAALLEQLGISQESAYGILAAAPGTASEAGATAAPAAAAGGEAGAGSTSLASAFLTTAEKGGTGADSSVSATYAGMASTADVHIMAGGYSGGAAAAEEGPGGGAAPSEPVSEGAASKAPTSATTFDE